MHTARTIGCAFGLESTITLNSSHMLINNTTEVFAHCHILNSFPNDVKFLLATELIHEQH